MASTSELTSLREKIQAIIEEHGGQAKACTKGQFVGAVDPNNAITYLTGDEFEYCFSSGFIRNSRTNVFAQQGSNDGNNQN